MNAPVALTGLIDAVSAPDARLLHLCGTLQGLRAMWDVQRGLSNDEQEEDGPQMRQLLEFEDQCWPGYKLDSADCPMQMLIGLTPVTPEGRRVKAQEALALHIMWMENDCPHPRLAELVQQVLADAAGQGAA